MQDANVRSTIDAFASRSARSTMLGPGSLRPVLAASAVASTSRAACLAGAATRPSAAQARRGYARQQSWDADEDDAGDRRDRGQKSWHAPKDLPPHWATRKDGKGAEPKKRKKQPRVIEHPPPTEEDLKRYAEMRVRRAERLERKDLTAQLTPVKTCSSVFPLSAPTGAR